MRSFLTFLKRNKVYTAIEAVGLAISLAFVILIGTYVWQQNSIAHENPYADRTFFINTDITAGMSYWDKAEIDLKVPEVEVSTRYTSDNTSTLYINDEPINLSIAYLDPEFFDIFPYYEIKEAIPDVLKDKNQVFVSRSFANRIAKDGKSAIGTIIEDKNTHRYGPLTVVGIVEDHDNSLLPVYDIYTNIENLINPDETPFQSVGNVHTIFRVHKGSDRKAVEEKVIATCNANYGNRFKIAIRNIPEEFYFENAQYMNKASKSMMRLLLIVVIALLVSAILNYINLSFALTGKRAKEMATRRLVGANKSNIFSKNILESVAFTSFCVLFALGLAYALVPVMNSLLVGDDSSAFIPLTINITVGYIGLLLAFSVLIGVIVGIAPALLAAKFEPIDIMKGSFRLKSKMLFSRIFIIIQNALAIVLIGMGIIMEKQMNYMLARPMNANIQNQYFMRIGYNSMEEASPLINRLESLSEVKRVGVTTAHPGAVYMMVSNKELDDRGMQISTLICDSTYFSMINPQIVENYNHPQNQSLWISESVKNQLNANQDSENLVMGALGYVNGTKLDYLGGVIKDVPTSSASDGMSNPLFAISVQPRSKILYMIALVLETYDESLSTKKTIQNTINEYINETGHYGVCFMQDWTSKFIADGYAPAYRTVHLVEIFMILAVLLSLMGLIAMSTYFSEQKAKEVAVRKIFGGTVGSESFSIVKNYMIMVGISCIIAVPIMVIAIDKYLQNFSYKLESYWWICIIACIIAVVISLSSILWQTLKVAKTNPSNLLKND